jgi:hypothetical protein
MYTIIKYALISFFIISVMTIVGSVFYKIITSQMDTFDKVILLSLVVCFISGFGIKIWIDEDE